MRGLERIFYVARRTVARWIQAVVQALPDLKDTLLPAEPDDVLELDELWSFVLKKSKKRWLWTALCRRTRQIVAFVIGDRSAKTCRRLWNKIPDEYKPCLTFSDFWEAYQKVFPKGTHRCVGKESGETAHMERWYNTLRQRLARFVRKMLSRRAPLPKPPGCRAGADDPWCIGVYTDNELPWSLSFVQSATFLNAYMTLPAGAPGKVALQAHLSGRYGGDVAAFNATWGTHLADFDGLQNLDAIGIPGPLGRIFETTAQRADRKSFVEAAAARYHSVVHDAIRALSPDVLVLGSRFISVMTPPSVMAAAAPYVDVLSINSYHFVPELVPVMDLLFPNEGFGFLDDPWSDLDALYAATGKPVLITEYSYRAYVPDGPPSWMPPGYAILRTQAERAAYYSHFTNELYDRPFVVGAHWFQWMDQPASGRGGDGENNNFGVVTITDDTYVELTDAMRAMNGAVRVREP